MNFFTKKEPKQPRIKKFTVTLVNGRLYTYEAEDMILWPLLDHVTVGEGWVIFETNKNPVAAMKTSSIWKVTTEEAKEELFTGEKE